MGVDRVGGPCVCCGSVLHVRCAPYSCAVQRASLASTTSSACLFGVPLRRAAADAMAERLQGKPPAKLTAELTKLLSLLVHKLLADASSITDPASVALVKLAIMAMDRSARHRACALLLAALRAASKVAVLILRFGLLSALPVAPARRSLLPLPFLLSAARGPLPLDVEIGQCTLSRAVEIAL